MTLQSLHCTDYVKYWKERWRQGHTGFHKADMHPMLKKHLDKLIPDGKTNKIFFPLCGKAVDMKRLADMGFTVVGVERIEETLEAFFTEQGMEWIVEDWSKSEPKFKLYKSKDDKIRLYNGNMLHFTIGNEGTFDAVWDRGSLVSIPRAIVPKYVQVMKSLLSPGGRILVELFEYDASQLNDIEDSLVKPPPPYAMYEAELKNLFEPDCTVEFVERCQIILFGKESHSAIYLITKTS